MATKSFSYSLKKYNIFLIFVFLLGCQNLKIRSGSDVTSRVTESNANIKVTDATVSTNDKAAETKNAEVEKNHNSMIETTPTISPQKPLVRNNYKFGIILGPGGARSFAHIAALQEVQRLKLPVKAIVGMEFSAMPAAVFAQNLSGNDVEWQMNKLRDEDFKKSSLFKKSGFALEANVLKDFLSATVNKMKVEQGKIPFACPSFNIKKNQTFMMSRGFVEQLLPFCMSYPPYFAPYQESIAVTRDLKPSIEWLKQQGANYILFINVLGAPQLSFAEERKSIESVLWAEIAAATVRPVGVDNMLNLQVDGFSIDNFSDKREIFQKTSDMTIKQVNSWAQQFGF